MQQIKESKNIRLLYKSINFGLNWNLTQFYKKLHRTIHMFKKRRKQKRTMYFTGEKMLARTPRKKKTTFLN